MNTSAAVAGLPVLALIDASSVGTVVIPLMLLLSGRGPARGVALRTAGYLLAIGAFYAALGAALLAGLLPLHERLVAALSGGPGLLTGAAVGALLVLWSWWADPATIRRRGGDPEQSARRWIERARRAATSWRALIGLALLAGVIEAASMVPYLAAMAIIADAGWGLSRGVLAILGYCGLMIAPGLVLAGARALLGSRGERALARLEAWAVRHASSAFSWGIGIIGVIVLVRTVPGVIDLAQG